MSLGPMFPEFLWPIPDIFLFHYNQYNFRKNNSSIVHSRFIDSFHKYLLYISSLSGIILKVVNNSTVKK